MSLAIAAYSLVSLIKDTMTASEIQDFIHVYSMVAFKDGSRESGILVNKYNSDSCNVDFYFIEHDNMQTYKMAFENYDRQACQRLSRLVEVDDITSIRPVTLSDYKVILQLLNERRELKQNNRGFSS